VKDGCQATNTTRTHCRDAEQCLDACPKLVSPNDSLNLWHQSKAHWGLTTSFSELVWGKEMKFGKLKALVGASACLCRAERLTNIFIKLDLKQASL
jgi:hypothetical protein